MKVSTKTELLDIIYNQKIIISESYFSECLLSKNDTYLTQGKWIKIFGNKYFNHIGDYNYLDKRDCVLKIKYKIINISIILYFIFYILFPNISSYKTFWKIFLSRKIFRRYSNTNSEICIYWLLHCSYCWLIFV